MISAVGGGTIQVRLGTSFPSFSQSSRATSTYRCFVLAGSPSTNPDLGDETLNGVLRSVINEVNRSSAASSRWLPPGRCLSALSPRVASALTHYLLAVPQRRL